MDAAKNYYRILGISPDADAQSLKAAFRARAKELHPDLHPSDAKSAAARFRELTEAYRVLSDPMARARHDRSRRWKPPPVDEDRIATEAMAEQDEPDDNPPPEWTAALARHPGWEAHRRRVALCSADLAAKFRFVMLKFEFVVYAEDVAQRLTEGFLSKYFGADPAVRRLAWHFLNIGERDLARDLNALVLAHGSGAEAGRIVNNFFSDFRPILKRAAHPFSDASRFHAA